MLLSNSVRLLLITSLFVSGSDALGCKGGDTFNGGGDKCNLNSVSCTEETCVKDMGGLWTADCPDPAADCDPLAPSDVDPSCTGQPESIDRGGKKMYRRKKRLKSKAVVSNGEVFQMKCDTYTLPYQQPTLAHSKQPRCKKLTLARTKTRYLPTRRPARTGHTTLARRDTQQTHNTLQL